MERSSARRRRSARLPGLSGCRKTPTCSDACISPRASKPRSAPCRKALGPCGATGSTAIMAKFPLLSGIKALTIIADHDANGAGERAAAEVASRWREAGKEARVWRPKSIGDLNDILIGGAK